MNIQLKLLVVIQLLVITVDFVVVSIKDILNWMDILMKFYQQEFQRLGRLNFG
jgi:hypothetical protein